MKKNIEDYSMEDLLGFVVNRTSIMFRKKLTSLFKAGGCDITPEEFAILSQLWEVDGLFQSEINDKTLKDKTTVTRLLERLKSKGLIEKKIDTEDRRNYKIYLTDKGQKLKLIAIPIAINHIEASTRNINSEDLEITIKTLKEINKNLYMQEEE